MPLKLTARILTKAEYIVAIIRKTTNAIVEFTPIKYEITLSKTLDCADIKPTNPMAPVIVVVILISFPYKFLFASEIEIALKKPSHSRNKKQENYKQRYTYLLMQTYNKIH